MTRCCELVDIFKKTEIGISYEYDVESGSCPFEITYDLPGTVAMDNNDFKDGTLMGAN